MSDKQKILSLFVDESGTFQYPDPDSRFYVVGMVFHDQDFDIQPLVRHLDQNVEVLGLDKDTFYFANISRRFQTLDMISKRRVYSSNWNAKLSMGR